MLEQPARLGPHQPDRRGSLDAGDGLVIPFLTVLLCSHGDDSGRSLISATASLNS